MPDLELQREWEARVAEFRASGLSGAKWCQTHGLKTHQFYYWLGKNRAQDAEPAGPAKWLQVEVRKPMTAAALQVRVGQTIIEVVPGFDPELLTDVVRALGGLC